MLKYSEFLFEKFGIISELEIIADDIISKIGNNAYLVYNLNYLNFEITINISIRYNKKYVGHFQVEDSDKFIFNIRLNDLDKSTLIHELKHLDRCIRRNFKRDTYFYINHIGRLITDNYRFLFKSKDDVELLLDIFYLCNPDEFESYYHSLYYDIKNEKEINDNSIKNIIENEYIYKLHKRYYKNKFNLLDFFNSKKDCDIFLNEFINRQELFYNEKDAEIKKIDKIKWWFRSKINKFTNNNEIKYKLLLKDINYYVNKNIQNNYNKFYRLYNVRFLNENKSITPKEELLGKKFYHGTTLETWKNSDGNDYLFIVDEFEVAKNNAVDRTESMVNEYNRSFTAIVVEIVINDKIIDLNWEVDDDLGNWSREPLNYKHWYDSYNNVGSFVIQGRYDINDFKIVYKEKFK